MFEAYKEEQQLNEINNGGRPGYVAPRNDSSSDSFVVPPKSGAGQPGFNPPPSNAPVQIASSHRPDITPRQFPQSSATGQASYMSQSPMTPQMTPPATQPMPQSMPQHVSSPPTPPQTADWGNTTLRAAQQYSPAMTDEATVRRALLGERQNDARLNDVCFATPLIGWAVGDCGVIWHTQNGGQNWRQQESGTGAPLFAVDFIDPQNGFAVGGTTEPYSHRGCGIVLRTSNGGQSWERLANFPFPILYCVRIDVPGRLWVAGSSSEQCPTGIMRTSDNGQTWQMQPGAKNEGWASLGFIDAPAGSNFGSNVDTSGGVKIGAGIGLDGAIQVVREKPTLSKTPPLGLRRANAIDVFSPRFAPQMPGQNASPYTGWLVGDGGVIMCSRNTGMAWEVPQGFLPIDRPDLFDFQAVFARDTNIWVAGTPGTLIFYSNDCGANWQAAPSGITTPIRKIRFITPQQGYAVGDLGVILATPDGGRTWHTQRAGGTRLAVLGLFGRMQDVPYEAMARLCLDEGHLGGVSVLFRQDSMRQDGNEIPAVRRLHEATVNCGGTSSMQPWAFSIDHDELPGDMERVIERLELENDGHGLARLREHLVATIRTWRPNVLLVPGNTPSNNTTQNPYIELSHDPARDLLQREIVAAVQAAANPMAYPEQLTETGLQTWQVDKVHMCCNATAQQQGGDAEQQRRNASAIANMELRTQTLAARYGKTWGDMAQAARSLFDTEPVIPAAVVPFRTVFDALALQQNRDPAEVNRGSLMGAISLPNGSEARRATQGLSMIPQYENIQQRIMHQNTARSVISGLGRGGRLADGNFILAQVDGLTQRLDRESSVQTLLEMGNRLYLTGQWDGAAEIYQRLAGRDPTHVSTKAAYAWLLQYLCSFNEGERAGEHDAVVNLENAKFDATSIDRDKLFGMTNEIGLRSTDMQGSRKINDWSTGQARSTNQYGKALMLADFVNKVSPEVLNDPRVRFCLAAAQIKNGESRLAEGYYLKRSMAPNDDLWAVRAASEMWANGSQNQGRSTLHLPTISCRFTAERPFLDGKLNDEVWSQCAPVVFSSDNATTNENRENADKPAETLKPQIEKTASRDYREQTSTRIQSLGTEAMFLYDHEFLYVALRCRKSDGFAYRYRDFSEIPRTHDPNLSGEDRVEMLLDLKRNYTTYDTFELDYRGWISESKWHDKNWNPRWFVARHEDETHWYVEAAIPLDQLTDAKPKPGVLWGIALRRLVPCEGIDAWNAKNSFNTREGFGYLVFE